jgi:hypothetical protein
MALDPAVQRKLKLMPKSRRNRYLQAMSGRSRKAAIDAFCAECFGWENVPGNVRNCTSSACPLYRYRPYQ